MVDIDLEKFFDRVNHDILMGRVAKRVVDKRILKLIRGFLTAGVMADGLVGPTDEGTPQGGPLSPLLSNLMLDELDKELERRGHRFVRYADDCNIYVRSQRAGERVMASVEPVPRQAAQAQGQQGQERGGPAERAQVPGLQLHGSEAAAAADRAAGAGPVQGAGPGTDAADAGREPRADRSRSFAPTSMGGGATSASARPRRCCATLDQWIRRRLRAIAWKQWNADGTGSRSCDAAASAGSGGADRRQRTRPLADRRQPGAQHRPVQRPLRRARPAFPGPNRPLNPPNRRIRTRMHGGVGGEEPRGSPLSRFNPREGCSDAIRISWLRGESLSVVSLIDLIQ